MAVELKADTPSVPPIAPAAHNPLDELIQAAADRKERPKAWVDVKSYPWADESFSGRFVRRANYQDMYGMKDTGEEVDDLISLLGVRPKARVLDLCSGNGRHAIAMALRGCKVTGIDVGPGSVSLARDTSKNLGLSVDYRQLDVLSIAFEDAYDSVYLVCAGLSDFSVPEAKDLMGRIERALVVGGAFVGEFLNAESAAKSDVRTWRFVQTEKSLFVDGAHLQLDERLYDDADACEVIRSFVVPSDGKLREFACCRQYYKEDTVRSMLEAAGLQVVGFSPGSAAGLIKVTAKKAEALPPAQHAKAA